MIKLKTSDAENEKRKNNNEIMHTNYSIKFWKEGEAEHGKKKWWMEVKE